MLTYNTRRAPLPLPEYGRAIQQMVDYCLSIPDREERTRCAHTIVRTMATLFPELKESEASRLKLWDHLAIMAGHRLDIDWPVEPPQPAAPDSRPDKIPYPATNIRMKHYGRSLELMLRRLSDMPDGEEKDELIYLLANQMKKDLAVSGLDTVDDSRVLKDLAIYTHGEVNLNPADYPLHDYEIIAPVSGKKRRRK